MKTKLPSVIILLLSLFAFSDIANAQAPNWLWSAAMGDVTEDLANAVAVDASGNVYTAGYFSGTIDFDPGAGTFNLTSNGVYDIFIFKLNSSGNFIWAKAMGGNGASCQCSGIALDASANVYTTGSFAGTVDFDPGVGTNNLTSGPNDIFISKLDSLGNFVWAKAMGGPQGSIGGTSIAVDAGGDVYTTGNFSDTVDFDPDSSGIFNLTVAGNHDVFISRLNSSGDFVWAKAMGGTGGEALGTSITIDASGNVYTTGIFNTTLDFNPDSLVDFNLTSAGGISDIFISKLDGSGNFVWAQRIGSTGWDQGSSITTDATGNVYSTGLFNLTVDFDPGVGTHNLSSAGSEDIYILKLDDLGNFVTAKRMGGTSSDRGYSLALGTSGNIYSTGYFNGTVDFDPDAGTYNLSSAGFNDVFISKLDNDENFIWAQSAGGQGGDNSKAIALDNSGNALVAGYYYAPSISFGSDTFINADSYGDYPDLFIAKLAGTVTGIESIKSITGISVYPNPAADHFQIEFSSASDCLLSLIDAEGRIFLEKKLLSARGNKHIEVNTESLDSGFYLLRIETEDGVVVTPLMIAK